MSRKHPKPPKTPEIVYEITPGMALEEAASRYRGGLHHVHTSDAEAAIMITADRGVTVTATAIPHQYGARYAATIGGHEIGGHFRSLLSLNEHLWTVLDSLNLAAKLDGDPS